MYKIIRFYRERHGGGFLACYKRTIKTGLTIEEAQAHCTDPETSSSTCAEPANLRRTRAVGQWFDGYDDA